MHIRASDYEHLSYREIRYRLANEGWSLADIDQHILHIKAARHVRSNERRKLKEHNKRWAEVIAALQHERRIVRGMVRYKTKTPAPERDEFVEQYYAVLDKLYEKLLARKNRGEGEPPVKTLPEYDHWTDFVPDRIKRAFRQAAVAVPQRDKAKFKEPFQRTSPAALSDLRRGRLLRYVRATLDTLLTRIDENPDDPKLGRKEWLLREAIKRINAMPPNAHIPNHWADVVRDKLNEGDDTGMADKIPKKPPKKRGTAISGQARATTTTMAMLSGQIKAEKARRIDLAAQQPLKVTVAQILNASPSVQSEKPDDDDARYYPPRRSV